MAEHILGIAKIQVHHSGAVKHFVECHNGNIGSLGTFAIEDVPKPIRRGDWRQKLLKRVAFWILRFGHPSGMNLSSVLYYIYWLTYKYSSFLTWVLCNFVYCYAIFINPYLLTQQLAQLQIINDDYGLLMYLMVFLVPVYNWNNLFRHWEMLILCSFDASCLIGCINLYQCKFFHVSLIPWPRAFRGLKCVGVCGSLWTASYAPPRCFEDDTIQDFYMSGVLELFSCATTVSRTWAWEPEVVSLRSALYDKVAAPVAGSQAESAA